MFGDKEFGKNAGYPTPTETPTDLTCLTLKLPANADWWAVYSGLLLTLTDESAWQQFEGGITREQAAHCALEIYTAAIEAAAEVNNCGGCALPSGAAVVGLDELGSWRMLDNGDWGPPSGDYALPDYTPRTEPTADERKCLAAKNAANVMKELYEQVTDIAQLGLPIAEAIVLFAAGIGVAIAGPLGLLAGAFMEIALIAIKEFFSAALFITEDVWDEGFDENLICTLLSNATDAAGVVTFDYDQVYTDLQLQTFWLDPTIAAQRLCGQLLYLLQCIGAEGLNLAGETTAITDEDCGFCGETWCYKWDFRVSAGNWTLYPGQPGEQNSCGLESGLTFAGADPSRGRRQTIWQFLSFPSDAVVKSVYGEQEIASIGNVSAGAAGVGFYQNSFGVVVTTGLLSVGHNEGGMTGTWTSIADWQILFSVGACDGCGDPGGDGCWTILTMTGEGPLPTEFFGGEDCSE